MRVALLSYPMLFQRLGGLQVQVRETVNQLQELGIDARVIDPYREMLADFDIVHVFSALNGNHRMVQSAREAGCKVVLSPVLNPPFTAFESVMARFCESLTGRLTGWRFHTLFRQIWSALEGADVLIALGGPEKDVIVDAYNIDPGKVRIVPNGVARRFFDADGAAFRRDSGIDGRFALQVGSVSPYKNQLAGIRSLTGQDLHYVMIGGCAQEHRPYLEQCLKTGNGKAHYLGAFSADDPLLASAYAAAEIFVLPSDSEVMPLVVLESLAAGTPAVTTVNSSLKFEDAGPRVVEVDPRDEKAIGGAVRRVLEARPDKAVCQALVAGYSWRTVAEQISNIYEEVLRRP